MKNYNVGDKVYIIDKINVFGREFLVIEPGTIIRDYRDDSDFNGHYGVQVDYNDKYIGAYSNKLLPRDK